jgi:hypothetical protein
LLNARSAIMAGPAAATRIMLRRFPIISMFMGTPINNNKCH